jgi:tetratricopeptide (TPR) repeat protein
MTDQYARKDAIPDFWQIIKNCNTELEDNLMGLELLKEYLDNKKYKEALAFLQSLLNDGNVSKNDIYLETAKIYYHLSEYDNALKYLFMLKDGEYSEQYMVYFEIGKIYNEISDYKKAVVNLQKSLDLAADGNTMKAYIAVLLAKIYKTLHKYDSAVEILNKIKNKSAVQNLINETYCEINEELYQRFPGNYGFDGSYDKLIANYLKELSENPFNSQVLCFLAQAYNYNGMYKETVNLYENNSDKIKGNAFFENKFLNEYEIAAKKTALQSKPRNLMAVLSNKCNIACIMCLTSRSKWELPKERLDEIISLFPYLERVMWQGGEVLFLPYFKDILKHALNYPNMRQSLITNFQLADEEIIELIVKNKI